MGNHPEFVRWFKAEVAAMEWRAEVERAAAVRAARREARRVRREGKAERRVATRAARAAAEVEEAAWCAMLRALRPFED